MSVSLPGLFVMGRGAYPQWAITVRQGGYEIGHFVCLRSPLVCKLLFKITKALVLFLKESREQKLLFPTEQSQK